MGVRGKLVELLKGISYDNKLRWYDLWDVRDGEEDIADWLIAHGVTVQEHGYWETVVEVRDNTVCGNGAKIEYKRCSRCKNPAKFFEDDF